MSKGAVLAADALGAAISARSVDQLRDLYADNIVVWHGSTGIGQSKDENIGLLSKVFMLTSELQYENIRRHSFGDGIVQQHRLTGMFADGRSLPSLEACLVILVDSGRITRIDEYFDGSHFSPVWEAIAMIDMAQNR